MLMYAGRLLEDGYTLSDYGIRDGAKIVIGRINVAIPVCASVDQASFFPCDM